MFRTRSAAPRRKGWAALLGAVAAAAAGIPLAAGAADAGAYEVEVLVFRYADPHASTPEVPPPAVLGPAAPTPTPEPAAGVTSLDGAALRLAPVAARLRRGPAYQLLWHGGWSQAAGPRAQSAPTPLPAPALQAGLGGAITLYRERYLHALVDVSLPAAGEPGKFWRIRQARRLRGASLQYFDNPEFGVILAVRAPAGVADAAGTAAAADEEP